MHNHAHIWGWKALITAVADGRWRGSASLRNSRLRALAGPAAPSLCPGRALPLLPACQLLRLAGSRVHLSAAPAREPRAGQQSPLRLRFTASTRRAPEDSATLFLVRSRRLSPAAAPGILGCPPSGGECTLAAPPPPRHEEVDWYIKPRRCFGDGCKRDVFQVLRNGLGRIFFLRPGCNRSQFLVVARYE